MAGSGDRQHRAARWWGLVARGLVRPLGGAQRPAARGSPRGGAQRPAARGAACRDCGGPEALPLRVIGDGAFDGFYSDDTSRINWAELNVQDSFCHPHGGLAS